MCEFSTLCLIMHTCMYDNGSILYTFVRSMPVSYIYVLYCAYIYVRRCYVCLLRTWTYVKSSLIMYAQSYICYVHLKRTCMYEKSSLMYVRRMSMYENTTLYCIIDTLGFIYKRIAQYCQVKSLG